jgi:hypothetical protein
MHHDSGRITVHDLSFATDDEHDGPPQWQRGERFERGVE